MEMIMYLSMFEIITTVVVSAALIFVISGGAL